MLDFTWLKNLFYLNNLDVALKCLENRKEQNKSSEMKRFTKDY